MTRTANAVALGAASVAAVAFVMVAISSTEGGDPIADVLAELSHRPTFARLSGTVSYQSYQRTFRPELARQLRAELKDHPFLSRGEQLRAFAVISLIEGDAAAAAHQLGDVVGLVETEPVGPDYRAAILNDFAAVHFQSAQARRPKSLIVGLDAIEKAWDLDRTPSIAWTRAVLLSALASEKVASRAWDDYLAFDRDSRWATEAKRERERVRAAAERPVRTHSLPVRAAGSAAIEEYDRMLEELSSTGDRERAAAVLLARAQTLAEMRATDEAWADLLEARMLISGRTAVAAGVVEALGIAAARDGYLHAARALFTAAMSDTGEQAYVRLAQWRAFVHARIDGGSIAAHADLLPPADDERDSPALRATARFSSNTRSEVVLSLEARAVLEPHQRGALLLRFPEAPTDVIRDSALSALFAESVRALYEREARIEIANGSPAAALWLSDQARLVTARRRPDATCVVDARDGASAEELGRKLARCVPDGITLVHQDLEAENLHTWVIRDGGVACTTTPVSAARLLAQIERFGSDVARSSSDVLLRRQARALYDVLLRPIERHISGNDLLVYSPSPKLRDVPISALHDGRRFLVETRVVTATPAIASFQPPRTAPRAPSALVTLPLAVPPQKELPGAEREVRDVAKLYGANAVLLSGRGATPEAFLDRADEHDVLHIATHGLPSDLPHQTAVAFGTRRVRAYDVFRLGLDRAPVVILSACRTADESGGPANLSVASAFLAAGASAVIASLWNVDDDDTAELAVAFHRELVRGATPHDALRAVQLDFIRRGRPISAWAAFQVSS